MLRISSSQPARAAGSHPLLRLLLAPLGLLYTAYAGTVFIVLALLALLAVLVVPGLAARRVLVRGMARGFLALAGLPLQVRNARYLPDGPCVVVANHASYLDGVLLAAVLPPRFGFVIKREMASVPLAGLLLRRIGAQFVERGNRQRGAGDALRVMRAAADGQSLAFFPEGTFAAQPGLLRFHAGAFVTAARAALPLVALVIRGTRRALPPSGALPLPARLCVEFLEPLATPDGNCEQVAAALRARARAAMLAVLQEPDLMAGAAAQHDG